MSRTNRTRGPRRRGSLHNLVRSRPVTRHELVSDAYVRYERQGWVTDYSLAEIGDESQPWTYNAAPNGWNIYVVDTRVWTLHETALMYGVRWDANVPSVDGEQWAGGQVAAQDYRPYAIAGLAYHGAALYPTCVSEHMNRQPITAVQFPVWTDLSHSVQTRLRYYRILHNTTPVTGILEACDEDDWSSAWTGPSHNNTLDQIYNGIFWTLPTPSSYRFTRGVRLGLDAWVELRAPTAGSHTIELYAASTHTAFADPAARWSHGAFGVTTGANAGFDASSQTYSLTMTGGTWRPYQTSPSDDFKWLTASGHTITTSKCETAAESASRDYLLLDWTREIPMLKIVLGGGRTADSLSTFVYIPEDASDYVQRWNNIHEGSTVYFYAQSPGGKWNHRGTTTFVPQFGVVNNIADSFTDQTVTARPTSITVTRAAQ